MWSLMLNSSLSGITSAKAFIITNTILHLGNVLLVFWLTRLLLKKPEDKILPTTGKSIFIAFVTALLFAIHPMRVESVTWVSERKDVLYAFFFLGALISYLKYQYTTTPPYLFYCFLLFVASCFSKGQAVILPVVLLLFDYWNNRTIQLKVLLEKLPFLVVAIVFGLIAIDIQGGGNLGGLLHPVAGSGVALKPEGINFSKQITYAGYGFMMYWVHLFFPVNLSPMYMFSSPKAFHPEYILGLVVMLVIVAWGIYSLKRNKVISFGIGFFVITILLVLQFLQVGGAIMADRYTYLPYFGLFFMIAFGIAHWSEQQDFRQKLAIGLLVVWLAFFFVMTRKQVSIWQNTGTLFTRRIELFPEDDYRAYSVVAKYMGEVDNNIEAVIAYSEKAIALGYKEDAVPWANLATAYEKKGDYAKSIQYHNDVVRLYPSADAYLNRGNTYLNAQLPAQALPDLRKALAMPNNARKALTIGSLATAQLNAGLTNEALANYNIAINQYGSTNAEYYYNRGVALNQLGKVDAAIADIQKCVQLQPSHIKGNQALVLLGVKK